MKGIDIENIADIVDGELISGQAGAVSMLSIDSRTVIPSDDVLFFCIRGVRNNGHSYIENLIKKGVSHFVIDEKFSITNHQASYIVVKDTLRALQQLASWRRGQFNGKVIGITGSNGKTIVKEWLSQCLQSKFKLIRSPKSYNSQVGVPLSVWLLDGTSDMAIFEAGISQKGEMYRLEKIIKPDIGIFTNIGEAHQENFSSYEEKAHEKLDLFKNTGTIIYRKDHELLDQLIKSRYPDKELISWSTIGNSAWLQVTNIKRSPDRTEIAYVNAHANGSLSIPYSDAASLENAMHVLTVLLYLKFNQEQIARLMERLSPVAMRLEQKRGINNCIIINDSYNSDLHSLDIALDYLGQQPKGLKRTVILSDILQSGRPEKELYKTVANLIQKRNVHRFIGIGKSLYDNRSLFEGHSLFYPATSAFLDEYPLEAFSHEAILLKGARPFGFERISAQLEEKLHRTVFEINLDALVHNLNYYRSLIPPGTKTMTMLKAFSYGSGTYEIARYLEHHKVDYFGVAIADEGVVLRKHGIYTPIMVMNPDNSSFQLITDYNLEPEIYSFKILHDFQKHLIRNGLSTYPVHLKIDTGMHRLGFEPEHIDNLIRFLQTPSAPYVKSVFSHLAASDEPQNDDFTKKQIQLYTCICERIQRQLDYPFMKHILNSAGIERFPDAAFDMVRLGIGLYGSSSHNQNKLLPVGKLKTTIIQVRDVDAHETIGYSRKGKFNEPKRIAVIPVGYADGLSRHLSNGKGYTFVKNKQTPIVGNICMDMTMIDITNIDAQVNDEVIIFGEKPTINEVARQMGTIPYEVLTSISQRVKRIYYRN